MKLCAWIEAAAFVALAAVSVWMGGLNQDEGWYLYAANLVAEGEMPYRDFFYTQGPLLPLVYSHFRWIWDVWGLAGARVFTAILGMCSMLAFACLAGMLAKAARGGEDATSGCGGDRRARAARIAAMAFLGCNLYHVYFCTIPKTYALGGLLVAVGFCFYAAVAGLSPAVKTPDGRTADGKTAAARRRAAFACASGFSLALAAGARISLGALLAVAGVSLLATRRRNGLAFLWFGLGGVAGLALVYGPFIADGEAFKGLCAAQAYHAARGGYSPLFTAGSVSRFVRWYAPLLFCSAALAASFRRASAASLTVLAGFAAVFLVQLAAPFPYEDYNVPVAGLLAAAVAAQLAARGIGAGDGSPASAARLALLLALTCTAGSPLLEKWTVNGQDRFWPLKKEASELAQLREAARKIETLDPGGKTLLTQDLYLAIETRRKVPRGLEMGPFSILDDAQWRRLLSTCDCPVAALSGYTFAIEPPACAERPLEEQFGYWGILRGRYDHAGTIEAFGQNATTLMLLKRKEAAK